MALLFAFSPFIAFVIIERIVGIVPGLIAAALVSAVLLLRDALSREREVKILVVGTFLLFAGLAAFAMTEGAGEWLIASVRLRVDGLMVAADLLLIYAPQLPRAIAVGVTIAALYGAYQFTNWYRRRARASSRYANSRFISSPLMISAAASTRGGSGRRAGVASVRLFMMTGSVISE